MLSVMLLSKLMLAVILLKLMLSVMSLSKLMLSVMFFVKTDVADVVDALSNVVVVAFNNVAAFSAVDGISDVVKTDAFGDVFCQN